MRLARNFAASVSRRQLGLLIDGDVFGPKHFQGILSALQGHGELRKGYVFACEARRWPALEYVAVARRPGGKDPNDIALSLEAARLVFQEKVDAIAVAAPDLDFLYLVDYLQRHVPVLALLPRQCNLQVLRAFGERCEVVRFESAEEPLPRKKMVMHPNGRCSIEDLCPEDFQLREATMDSLREQLLALKYLEDEEQPLLPALSKFAVVNGLSMCVWPKHVAYKELTQALQSRALPYSHDRVFVMPLGPATTTKKWLQACGTRKAVEYVRGGGAVCLHDHENLVEEVLGILGYYGGDELNQDLGEAIDVFASMKDNAKVLRSASLHIRSDFPAHRRRALVYVALVSARHGEWQVAPSDDLVLRYLVAHGWLGAGASRLEAHGALGRLIQALELPPRRSYHARVRQVAQWLHRNDPSQRNARGNWGV